MLSAKAAKMKSVWGRQERQMGLGAATASPKSAGTHRDQGLNYLVTRTLAVGLGLYEAGQTIALIRLQNMEGQRHHQSASTKTVTACFQRTPPKNKPMTAMGI